MSVTQSVRGWAHSINTVNMGSGEGREGKGLGSIVRVMFGKHWYIWGVTLDQFANVPPKWGSVILNGQL